MLIEIDLAGGGPARQGGRKRTLRRGIGAIPLVPGDVRPILLGAAVLGVAGLTTWNIVRLEDRSTVLSARVEAEAADSASYAATAALIESLLARQDSVLRKIEVIRGIDSRRFVWPRLLEVISLSTPPHAWLTHLGSAGTDAQSGATVFVVQGYAGSTSALIRLMKNLEGFSSIRNVKLVTTSQEVAQGSPLLRFSLEATYVTPDGVRSRTEAPTPEDGETINPIMGRETQ